jgi:hypothetical protein
MKGRLMLRLVVVLLVLACASPTWAACAYVQSAKGSWASGTSTTVNITATNGNTLVVIYFHEASNATNAPNAAPSDPTNGSYTLVNSQNESAGGAMQYLRMHYKENITGGALTITQTVTNASINRADLVVIELSGTATASALDQQTTARQTAPGTGTDGVTTGNVTPSSDGQCLVAAAKRLPTGAVTMTAGTAPAWSSRQTSTNQGIAETFDQGTAAAAAGTFTTSANVLTYSTIGTFKAAAGGGGGGTVRRRVTQQ